MYVPLLFPTNSIHRQKPLAACVSGRAAYQYFAVTPMVGHLLSPVFPPAPSVLTAAKTRALLWQ